MEGFSSYHKSTLRNTKARDERIDSGPVEEMRMPAQWLNFQDVIFLTKDQ